MRMRVATRMKDYDKCIRFPLMAALAATVLERRRNTSGREVHHALSSQTATPAQDRRGVLHQIFVCMGG